MAGFLRDALKTVKASLNRGTKRARRRSSRLTIERLEERCVPAVMGEPNILPSDDSGNANLLLAQRATLAQTGTLQTLSFYVTQAAGSLELGVYDASGPGGGPGKLLAQSSAFTPTVGWNTEGVAAVQLSAGNYWLAYLPSDNNLHFAVDRTSGSIAWYGFGFGAMPATFSTSPTTETAHWSFYATLTDGTPTIPAVPTGVTATAFNTQVSLTWNASNGAASYNLYRSTTSGGETLYKSGITGTSFIDTGLTNGAAYYYEVTAMNSAGESGKSSEVSGTPTLPSGTAPLLYISTNGRYLVDANNQPFYLIGDTAWALPAGLTLAQATTYFQTRASQGFNLVLMDADLQLAASPVGAPQRGPLDANGNAPFTAFLPGTNLYDVSKPNPVYWQNVDNILTIAAQNGVEVLFDVYDNYAPWFGFGSSPNSIANLTAYGQFLGQRYAGFDNIIWMLGNDYTENAGGDASLGAVIQGIRQFDNRHLGFGMDQFGSTFDNTGLRSNLQLNSFYEYSPGPWRSLYLSQYNRPDFGPTFNIESGYEFNTSLGVSEADVRDEHYSFLLNGATGDVYGNEDVWPFDSAWRDWQAALNSEGGHEMTYAANLIKSIPWYNLVPDQNGTVFPGVGSPTDYSGAYTADGTLALAYKPSTGTGSQSFNVNMGQFAGTVTAQWYDPTNGTYTPIGSFANSGSHTFTSASSNSVGQNDFVLVLKAAATAPATPTGLTTTPGNNLVTLSWNAAAGATSYNIYRSMSPGGEGSTPYKTGVTATSFTDIGLTNGTTYYYQVSAVNSIGQSGKSAEVSATPQLVAPPTPTGVAATSGNGQVTLTWNASSGATSYNIYRSTTSGGEGTTPFKTGVTTTSFTDTGLSNGTNYYYQVTAVNSAGQSPKTGEVFATPSNTELMGEPNVLSDDDSGNANLLLAQQASLAQAGTLQSLSFYVTQAAGSLRLGVYDASGPGASPGKLLAQTSPFTPAVGWNSANVTTPVSLPAGTYWLAYLPSDNNLHFAVDRTSGSIAFYSFAFGAMPATFSTSPTTGTSHWSFYATLTLGSVSVPAAPTGVAAAAGNAQVSLSWTASSGATSYNIYRSTSSGAEGSTPYKTGITTTSLTDTGLTNGTKYYYQVTAVSAGESARSSEVSATPSTPLVAYIQSSSTGSNTAAATIARAFTTTVTAGDAIIVALSWDTSAGSNVPTVTDSLGNTYTRATYAADARHNQALAIFYAVNVKGGADTVTAHFGVNQAYRRILIQEYRGIAAVSPVDVTASAIGSGTTASSGSALTTTAGNLVFGAIADDSGTTTITAGAGFTRRQFTTSDTASEDLIQTSTGAVAATASFSTSADYLAQMVAFRPNNQLQVLAGAPIVNSIVPPLTATQLTTAKNLAIAAWQRAGISAAQVALLRGVQFVITNLPGAVLSEALGSRILIDANAAGRGWSLGSPVPTNRVDLVTVVEHELGHALGLGDLDPLAFPGDLMDEMLPMGVRRLPSPFDIGLLHNL
jgi:fibronectin type 3 domain-containing protein